MSYVVVNMEVDELEMTKEELQIWIRQNVKENKQIVEVLEKCRLLQSLLERRERQVTQLLRLNKWVDLLQARFLFFQSFACPCPNRKHVVATKFIYMYIYSLTKPTSVDHLHEEVFYFALKGWYCSVCVIAEFPALDLFCLTSVVFVVVVSGLWQLVKLL